MKTIPFATVPRLFPNGVVACLATGPSLTQADVDAVRAKVDGVIAVSDAVDLAPWATALFSCDLRWYRWRQGMPSFTGLKYTLSRDAAARWPSVQLLRNAGDEGLELDTSAVRTGKNSGFQAINVAVHMGASKIVLLGYDMHGDHFFGSHPDKSKPPHKLCIRKYATLVKPLRRASVEVVNCTPNTALHCFPEMSLDEALAS